MKEIYDFKDHILEIKAKQKIKFFVRLLIVGIFLFLITLYFLLPFSKVECFSLKGNYYFSQDEVLNAMGLKRKSFIMDLDKKKIYDRMENHALINDVKIKTTFFSLEINIKEKALVYKANDTYYFDDFTTLNDNIANNLLYKDVLIREKENIPTILNEVIQEDKINLQLMNKITLGICGYENVKIDYVKYEAKNDGSSSYNYYICFRINDEQIINKYFDNSKNAYFAFNFDASNINYYIKYKGLKYFANSVVKFYNELLNNLIGSNNVNASYYEECSNYTYRKFDLEFNTKKNELQVKKV